MQKKKKIEKPSTPQMFDLSYFVMALVEICWESELIEQDFF